MSQINLGKNDRPKGLLDDKYVANVQDFAKKAKATMLIIVIATFGITFATGTFDIVEAGTVRIAVNPDGTIDGPAEAGWHFAWCSPFAKRYDYTVTVQTVSIQTMHADTLDGHVNIDLTVSYILHKEHVIEVFERFGPQAAMQAAIEPVIQSSFRDAFAKNTMRAVALENRTEISQLCKESIKADLESHYFVEFVSLQIQNILLPTAYSEAQILTQIAYEELRAANITHQIQILAATTAAEVSIISAESLANATIIQAASMAEAINLTIQVLNQSGNMTNDDLLTYLYIQALSDYAAYGDVLLITDGSTPVIITVPE